MSLSQFTLFPSLPPELRNKIWSYAAHLEPRHLDIWSDFKRCEIDNTIFYTQTYECELSRRPPPPIFRVTTESRKVALKHYSLEFATGMTLPNGISVSMSPRIYINFESDVLIPRGYWNTISFSDFATRCKGRLRALALDVNESFWKKNLRDYCRKGCWIFNGLEEVTFYETGCQDIWKGCEYLEKFRRRYRDGPKDLSFSGWEEGLETSKHMREARGLLERMLDGIEGKVEEVEEVKLDVGEDGEPVVLVPEVYPSHLKDCEATPADELYRPLVRFAKLEADEPAPVAL